MRLIDADVLISTLENQDYSCSSNTLEDWTPQDVTIAEICDINNAPTVDAVEVVRCKDCKYHMFAHCFRFAWDELKNKIVSDDDYCSFGEKKE